METAKKGNPRRLDALELARFFCTLAVMAHHCYNAGIQRPHFMCGAMMYVEWFFLVSGYMTCRHFIEETPHSGGICKNAVLYTIRKFKKLFFYTTIATIFQYVFWIYVQYALIPDGNWKDAIVKCADMPLDILLLSSAFRFRSLPHSVPLWYLSAMLLVFPWICIFFQSKNKELIFLLSLSVPVFFYGNLDVLQLRTYPNDLLRAFFCMMLGGGVYFISKMLAVLPQLHRRLSTWLLSAIEIGCFLLAAIICDKWGMEQFNCIFLLFFIEITLLLSGLTLSSRVQTGWMCYLGRLTVPMYIFHWSIGSMISAFFPDWTDRQKVLAYYGVTILFSVLILQLSSVWKKHRLKHSPPT